MRSNFSTAVCNTIPLALKGHRLTSYFKIITRSLVTRTWAACDYASFFLVLVCLFVFFLEGGGGGEDELILCSFSTLRYSVPLFLHLSFCKNYSDQVIIFIRVFIAKCKCVVLILQGHVQRDLGRSVLHGDARPRGKKHDAQCMLRDAQSKIHNARCNKICNSTATNQ